MLDFLQKTLQKIHADHDNGIRIYYGATEDNLTLLTHADGSIPYVDDVTAVEDNMLSFYGIVKTLYRTTLTVNKPEDTDAFVNQNFWVSFDFGETKTTANFRTDLLRYRTVLKAYWIYLEVE
mgnify:CR=1 FL=1